MTVNLKLKVAGIAGAIWLLTGALALADAGTFRDVPGTYPYQTYIDELSRLKLVDGTADGQFSPNGALTREQFAKLVVTAFGLPDADGELPFNDCTEAWSKPYIMSAYKAGIVQGISDKEFAPSQVVHKQEAAVMLARLFPAGAVQEQGNGQDWTAAPLAFIRKDVLTAATASLLNDAQAPLTRGEAAALISLSLHARDKERSADPSKIAQEPAKSPDGMTKDSALIIEPDSNKEVKVNLNVGQTLFVQANLNKNKTYELEAQGVQESAFDMTLSDASGSVLNQGYVNALQALASSDETVYGTIHADQAGGAVTVRVVEAGLDAAHAIKLKAGKFEQVFPQAGSLYFKTAAGPENPMVIRALGADSYQHVQTSSQWVSPTLYNGLRITGSDGRQYDLNGNPVQDVPGHNAVDANVGSSSLHGEPFAVNCVCGIRITAPSGSTVAFTVLNGGSPGTAYAIDWIGSEWKTGYRNESAVGAFYRLDMEQGKHYSISVNEQLNANVTTPQVDSTVQTTLTIYDPDGKKALEQNNTSVPLSFTAAASGSYVVELRSDAKGSKADIRITANN
jgi:hypothetical protein